MDQRRQTGRRIGMLLFCALVPALIAAWLHPLRPAWHRPAAVATVTVETVRHVSGVLWIDARAPEEFDQGHVAGALSLPPDQWNTYVEPVIEAWHPGKSVVVYCDPGACSASQSVARRLRDELGFENVQVLAGAWQEVGR